MRVVRLIAGRTFVGLLRSPVAAGTLAGFLAIVGALFAGTLVAAEGTVASPAALWALAAGRLLPALAAIATMSLWSGDGAAARRELLLTAPVFERDVVAGKFLGSFAFAALAVTLSLVLPLAVLPAFAPALAPRIGPLVFLPAFVALMLQLAAACAFGQLASACCRSAATAAVATLAVVQGVPYALYRAAVAWSPAWRAKLPEFPLAAHLADAGAGFFSTGAVVFYLALAAFALFAAVKAIAFVRFAGRGAHVLRFSTRAVVALAFVFTLLVLACAHRLDCSFDCSFGARRAFSARTRSILADAHGETRVTCFLARRDPRFRVASRLLRALEVEARAAAGVRLTLQFADPRWDLAVAARLVRSGVEEGSILFERGRRRIVLPAAEVDEAACATAVQRLALPAERGTVYFTTGHGEGDFASYDRSLGLSDFAREIRRDGYRLAAADLAAAPVPADCAVLVVCGARDAFSAAERRRLDAYLRSGGRLLAFVTADAAEGAGATLSAWGVESAATASASPRTRNGADVVCRTFADHAIVAPLRGSSLVFSAPVALKVAESGAAAGADKTTFVSLAGAEVAGAAEVSPAFAVALERGGGVSRDLALRPTRIVVVGDAALACNGALADRANANLDFLLNALAWLAGVDAFTAAGTPTDVLATGLDRRGQMRLAGIAALGWPLAVFAFFALARFVRRHLE